MQARTPASNRLAKANRASHGRRVKAKERVKRTKENPKDCPKEPRVRTKDPKAPKAHAKVKTSETGISGLENLNSEACSENEESVQMGQVHTADTSWIHEEWSPDEWNDGWSLQEWNDDWSSVGWHEGWEQTNDTFESSFSLESSEWAKMNLDTRAAVNTFPSNFGPEGIGDGSFYDWIPDGEAWQSQGYDENGFPRSLNGRLTDVHQVLCSAAEIACKGQQDFYLGHDGGYMIPIHSKIGQGMRTQLRNL